MLCFPPLIPSPSLLKGVGSPQGPSIPVRLRARSWQQACVLPVAEQDMDRHGAGDTRRPQAPQAHKQPYTSLQRWGLGSERWFPVLFMELRLQNRGEAAQGPLPSSGAQLGPEPEQLPGLPRWNSGAPPVQRGQDHEVDL